MVAFAPSRGGLFEPCQTRAHSLRTYLDQYMAAEGPLDEVKVQEFMQLLGGPSSA